MVSKKPQKTPLFFYRSASGKEPVREWLKSLGEADRKAVSLDLMRALALHGFVKKTQKTPDDELVYWRASARRS